MADKLNQIVISKPGSAIKMTRTETPDYLQKAISDSVERGRRDAAGRISVTLPSAKDKA